MFREHSKRVAVEYERSAWERGDGGGEIRKAPGMVHAVAAL
jgi:hypothetical protein